MKKVVSLLFMLAIVSMVVKITGCKKSYEDINATDNKVVNNATEFQIGNDKIELEKMSVLIDKVEILIPKSFNIMSEEMANFKYPTERRPTLIYTDEAGAVNIALNHTEDRVINSQIQEVIDATKKIFEKLYPSATWYSSGVKEINNKNVGYLEVLTPAIDTEIYNLMYALELDGRLLIITFNCTKELMNDWSPIAYSIMDSLNVKQ